MLETSQSSNGCMGPHIMKLVLRICSLIVFLTLQTSDLRNEYCNGGAPGNSLLHIRALNPSRMHNTETRVYKSKEYKEYSRNSNYNLYTDYRKPNRLFGPMVIVVQSCFIIGPSSYCLSVTNFVG